MCLQCIWRKKDPPDVLVEEFLNSLQGQAVLQCHVHSQDPGRNPERLEFVITIPADMRSRLARAFSLTDSRNLSDTRLTTSTALRESTSTESTGSKCANSLQCSFTWPCVTAVKVDKKAIGIEEFVNMFVKSGSFLGLTTFPCSFEAVSSWQLAHVEVDRVLARPQDTRMAELWHGVMDLQLTWQGRTIVVGNPTSIGLMKVTAGVD